MLSYICKLFLIVLMQKFYECDLCAFLRCNNFEEVFTSAIMSKYCLKKINAAADTDMQGVVHEKFLSFGMLQQPCPN